MKALQPASPASPPFLSHRGGRIVLPLDFSACAERALPRALLIAERAGAEVHLLHVLPVHAPNDPSESTEAARWFDLWREERARARLDTLRLAYRYGLHRRREVPLHLAVTVHPSAAEGIVAYADQHDADLIVMGTQGWGCGTAQAMGSVARHVIDTSGRPVMTLPVARPVKADVRRVVTMADPLDPSDALVGYARRLAELCGTTLSFIGPREAPAPGRLSPPCGQCGKARKKSRARLAQQPEALVAAPATDDGLPNTTPRLLEDDHAAGQLGGMDSLETTDVLVIPGALASASIRHAAGGLLAVPEATVKRRPPGVGANAGP